MDLYTIFFILASVCIFFVYGTKILNYFFNIRVTRSKIIDKFILDIFWVFTFGWLFSYFVL